MEYSSAVYFREKAAQCRRLATSIANQNDRAVKQLAEMAAEFEVKAEQVERVTDR